VATGGFSLPAGDSREIQVRFTPAEMGDFRGTLTLSHSATGGTTALALRGSGVLACLTAPDAVDFGEVAIGTSVTREVVLENSGNAPLLVTWISPSSPQFTVDSKHFTVLPGTPRTLNVSYTASAPGAQAATLRIIHNAAGGATDVPLTGQGIGAELSASTPSLDFGKVALEGSATEDLIISNLGTSVLNVSEVRVSNPLFEVATDPFSLAPGEELTLPVTFRPNGEGTAECALVLEGNCYHAMPCTITLAGEGVVAADPVPPVDDEAEPPDGPGADGDGPDGAPADSDTPTDEDPGVTPPASAGTVALIPAWQTDGLTKPTLAVAVRPGQEATFLVSADGLPSGTGYWFSLTYDPEVLTFERVDGDTGFLPDARSTVTKGPGYLVVSLESASGLQGPADGTVCGLTFRIGSAFRDTSRVALTSSTVVLPGGGSVQPEVGPAYELVKDPALVQLEDLIGDFNGDGKVDFADYVILRSEFFGAGTRCDLDGDGRVGFSDYLILVSWIERMREA
jgi:hypothetical protein